MTKTNKKREPLSRFPSYFKSNLYYLNVDVPNVVNPNTSITP